MLRNLTKKISLKNTLVVLAVAAFVWGAFLRVYKLGEQSYWMDEAFSINAAQEIVEKGVPLLDSGEYYDRAYVYHYILAGFMLTSDDPAVLRLPSVIFSLLSIFVVYGVARRLFPNSPEIAWITVIIMSLSYWEIAWARQVRMYSMLSFLTWLTVLVALMSFRNLTKIFLVGGCLLLAYDTHKLAISILPLAVFLSLNSWLWLSGFFKKYVKTSFWIFTIAFWAIFIGAIIYQFVFGYPLYGVWIVDNMPILIAGLVLAIFGFSQKHVYGFMILQMYVFLAVASLAWLGYEDYLSVSYRYLLFIYPAFYIVCALAAASLLNMVGKARVVGVVFMLLLVVSFQFYPYSFYKLESDDESRFQNFYSYTPQPDWNSAVKFLEDDRVKSELQDAVIISSVPAVYKVLSQKNDNYLLYDNSQKTAFDLRVKDVDYYTGADLISSVEQLTDIVTNNHGYILLDSYIVDDGRLSQYFQLILEKSTLIFSQNTNRWSGIYLYKF